MLEGKKILLGITGSIAAYKSILLLRQLTKAGAEVRVVMTPSARDFVSPLTLSTLSRNQVLVELFDEESWSNHVMLGRWADLMLIAPLSCNTLAKMANGLCDNLLLAVYLSAVCPVLLAPAMDEDMWHHPATQGNLNKLASYGHAIIPVGKGDLASGLYGDGRMAEPEAIVEYLKQHFFLKRRLKGKKVLVTAGPTYEALDPVRFVGNYSTGTMGMELVKELMDQGAEVTLVLGPVHVPIPVSLHKVLRVTSAEEMHAACMGVFDEMDMAIMTAAVADYAPAKVADHKIKKQDDQFTLEMKRTPDILKSLGERKKNGQVLVGFALETDNEVSNAKEKLKKKNADLIVLNSLREEGAGFGTGTNKVTLFSKSGEAIEFDTKPKNEVARDIVDTLIRLYYA